MKYIDAGKLKEIVDRVYKQYVYDYGLSAAGSNMRWIYDAIDSLQQEQQEVDLEKEIEKFCLEYDAKKEVWFDMTSKDKKMLSSPTWSNFAANIARHFYELGKNTRNVE